MKKLLLLMIIMILSVGLIQSAFAASATLIADNAAPQLTKTPKRTASNTLTPTPSPVPPTSSPTPEVTTPFWPTSPVPTKTSTPSPTPTQDCGLYTMSNFEIKENNHLAVTITNNNPNDDQVVNLRVTWQSAQNWAEALGYFRLRVDWSSWNGDIFYNGDDFTTPTELYTYLQLPAGTSNIWEIDFDFEGEETWTFQDVFGLTQENFGFYIEPANCTWLERPEIIVVPPEPDCNSYEIGDFYFGDYAHILVDVTNNDLIDTRVTGIGFNWDYAEIYDNFVDWETELNVDYIYYGGRPTWGDGEGSARDFNSPTNTHLDSPESFPGSWSSYELPPFNTNTTYTLDIDFDYEWPTFPSHLRLNDFGIILAFENGCTLSNAAQPRPLPNQQP